MDERSICKGVETESPVRWTGLFFMLFLDCTLETDEQNLALDEALLDVCDKGGPEVLRVWQPERKSVVVGYTQSVDREVNRAACDADGVPILRRITGGGTVLHDSGGLCYALVMRNSRPEFPTVGYANRRIAAKHREAIAALLPGGAGVEVHGDTDLALHGRKFSGNAQRRKIRAFLFHGTFLLNIDYDAMERYLRAPSRQPEYRAGRNHRDFMTELPLDKETLISVLRRAWGADEVYSHDTVPMSIVNRLVGEKYGSADWNYKL